jgi:hypothetical protein
MKPIREPIDPAVIPVGTSAYHRRIGQGVTAGPGYVVGHWWYIPIEFRRWDGRVFAPWKTLNCKVASEIGIAFTRPRVVRKVWKHLDPERHVRTRRRRPGSARLHTRVDMRCRSGVNARVGTQQDRELRRWTV